MRKLLVPVPSILSADSLTTGLSLQKCVTCSIPPKCCGSSNPEPIWVKKKKATTKWKIQSQNHCSWWTAILCTKVVLFLFVLLPFFFKTFSILIIAEIPSLKSPICAFNPIQFALIWSERVSHEQHHNYHTVKVTGDRTGKYRSQTIMLNQPS